MKNVEAILLLKYGTFDYAEIKKAHEEWVAFLRDANQQAKDFSERLRADIEKQDLTYEKLREEQRKASEELDEAMKKLKEVS